MGIRNTSRIRLVNRGVGELKEIPLSSKKEPWREHLGFTADDTPDIQIKLKKKDLYRNSPMFDEMMRIMKPYTVSEVYGYEKTKNIPNIKPFNTGAYIWKRNDTYDNNLFDTFISLNFLSFSWITQDRSKKKRVPLYIADIGWLDQKWRIFYNPVDDKGNNDYISILGRDGRLFRLYKNDSWTEGVEMYFEHDSAQDDKDFVKQLGKGFPNPNEMRELLQMLCTFGDILASKSIPF